MTQPVSVVICRTHPKATLPTYRTEHASGFDLTAVDYTLYTCVDNGRSHLAYTIRTGIKVAIPAGYCMKIYACTDLAQQYHARPAECVGIIDSDYRDEIIIKLIVESGARSLTLREGLCVAQGVIEKVTQTAFEEVTADHFAELKPAEPTEAPPDTDKSADMAMETRSAEKAKTAKPKAEK